MISKQHSSPGSQFCHLTSRPIQEDRQWLKSSDWGSFIPKLPDDTRTSSRSPDIVKDQQDSLNHQVHRFLHCFLNVKVFNVNLLNGVFNRLVGLKIHYQNAGKLSPVLIINNLSKSNPLPSCCQLHEYSSINQEKAIILFWKNTSFLQGPIL